ncbi:MAG: CRISPR-associated endonuclease Cas1 [Candidatus Loosdrechtia sp.]|uniref:CRISPR-associated endonuclease Cas1 n=1 Tax=Candidatus Loosdrechtia sp. TaxID=3101272 RepID=UPI003A658657|nr:MAG: CRISPR-associated endonuclease Cas1 [Candidatus Jettenia sp. AMX2]
MEKTLYLNENSTLSVTLDGPSIVVKEEGKSGRRVPARVIQRVVITGNIKLETGLITLFTQNNVPVTFLDKKGDRVAVTLPYKDYLPGQYKAQKTFFESDYSRRRYMIFLRAYRQRVQIDVLKRLLKRQVPEKFVTVGLKEEDYRQVIDVAIAPYGQKFQQVRNAVAAVFTEMVVGKLIASELDPHMGVMHRRRDFGLVLDICHIFGSEIDIQSIQYLKGRKRTGHYAKEMSSVDMKDIAVRFENRKETLVLMTDHIIDGIFELIRELRISGESSRFL